MKKLNSPLHLRSNNIHQVEFEATDGFIMQGLHFFEKSKSGSIMIFLHGTGSTNILKYSSILDSLAKEIIKAKVDLMAFNNRGSGYVSKISRYKQDEKETRLSGMAYEKISECVLDIEGAIKWALDDGYKKIYLAGHSTGANKLVYYSSKKNHQAVKKVFLLSGGDDISLQRSRIEDVKKYLSSIQDKYGKSNNTLIPPKDFPGEHPISLGSLKELLTTGSDYDVFPFARPNDKQSFYLYKKVTKPIICVYGSEDFGTIIPVEEAVTMLDEKNKNEKSFIVEGADHNYFGFEKELAKIIKENI